MSGPLGSSQWMYASGEKDALTIPYSCRFDNATGDYLSKTPASAGNRRLWTFSCWAKLGGKVLVSGTDGYCSLFGSYESSTIRDTLRFKNQQLLLQIMGSGFTTVTKTVDGVFRDPSAWYHIVAVWDSENGTAGDRVKIYVNGVQQTLTGTDAAGDEDSTFANDEIHYVGAKTADGSSVDNYWDGYMAEVHFIDGIACDVDDFGKTGDYGNWLPVEYTGSYGTNGFYLDFADSAALGDDESGNTNDFAVTNLNAYDQMLDTPSNNFCVMNPLDVMTNDGTKIKQGNLWLDDCDRCNGTMAVSSGKWYFEARLHYQHHGGQSIGINEVNNNIKLANWGNNGNSFDIGHPASGGVSGTLYVDGSSTGTGAVGSVVDGQLLGFMVDVDAQTITVHCDDAEIHSSLTDYDYSGANNMETITPNFGIPGGRIAIANFGQDSSFAGAETSGSANATDSNGIGDFYYEPPTDYLAICTANLPEPAVTPSEHFNTILYDDGAGAKTGVGFQPDLVWLKSRGGVLHNRLTDVVRGVTKATTISDTAIEATHTDGLTAFGADGFTVGTDSEYSDQTGDGMVAWNWKAGGSGSANTVGSSASTVSVNTDAGFSIVKYTGTGSTATVGHGLSKAPEMIIIRCLDTIAGTLLYYNAGGSLSATMDETDGLYMHSTIAKLDADTFFNDTAASSTVFTIESHSNCNTNTDDYIAYCFHSVEGYSKVDSYRGNANADGTMVHCGFRPALVIIKPATRTGHWMMQNNKSNPYNVVDKVIFGNDSAVEYTDPSSDCKIDFLSNGFKPRTDNDNSNDSGETYIYIAFAETPFKYANAR